MRYVSAVPVLLGFALSTPLVFTPAQKSYWAFQPVKKSPVPAVKNKAWVKTPIDAFILAKLEEKGLQPNSRADKLTLLRRVTIDVTGLPRPSTTGLAATNRTTPNWMRARVPTNWLIGCSRLRQRRSP